MRQFFFLIAVIVGFFYYEYSNKDESFKENTPFSDFLQTSLVEWYDFIKKFLNVVK